MLVLKPGHWPDKQCKGSGVLTLQSTFKLEGAWGWSGENVCDKIGTRISLGCVESYKKPPYSKADAVDNDSAVVIPGNSTVSLPKWLPSPQLQISR